MELVRFSALKNEREKAFIVESSLVRLIGEKGQSGEFIPAASSFAGMIRRLIDGVRDGYLYFLLTVFFSFRLFMLITPAFKRRLHVLSGQLDS
jgi:hypothetical protein